MIVVRPWNPEKVISPALYDIEIELRKLLQRADRLGVVVTVEQVARLPLAMGNYDTYAEIRLARVLAPVSQPVVAHRTVAEIDADIATGGGLGRMDRLLKERDSALASQPAKPADVGGVDGERAAFEAEVLKLSKTACLERYTKQRANHENSVWPETKVSEGDYLLSGVRIGWAMWQARAAGALK